MTDLLLTYDLGTTRLKVALFDLRGELLGSQAMRHEEHRDGSRRWQDANVWWHNAVSLTRTLLSTSAVDPQHITAISLTGRAGAGIFTDGDGQVLAQPWSDGRHREILAQLNPDRRYALYGATLVAKYRWLLDHEPTCAARIRHAFFGKDFLLFRLTGAHRTDPGSGPDALDWDPALVAAAGIPVEHLPHPGLPWELAGELTDSAAEALGLEAGIAVAIGAHDGICANVGVGATRPGQYALTLGTHAVVRGVSAHSPDGARRFYGLPPDRHVIGGNALWGGRAADWFLDLYAQANRADAFADFDREAQGLDIGADGALFLPYLGGRNAPDRNFEARAAFLNLNLAHTKAHLYRALLEGVAFALAEILEQVEGWCGQAKSLRLTGGGAASPVWRSILCAALDRPLEYSDTAAETRGAAIFAAVATGHYPDYDRAADAMATQRGRLDPDAEQVTRYREIYNRWRDARDASEAPLAMPSNN